MSIPEVLDTTNITNVENAIRDFLNNSGAFDDKKVIHSPRAVGDIAQEIVGENLGAFFAKNLVKDCDDSFARRAMADMAFSDYFDNYFVVDMKTHNKDTSFNMPNLISVERISRFYESDTNFFMILLAEYSTLSDRIRFDNVRFAPIEHLKWDCLTIGALGWGQIQIANANKVIIDNTISRKTWMLSLCDELDIFYPKEIEKIDKRIAKFKKVREFWENK